MSLAQKLQEKLTSCNIITGTHPSEGGRNKKAARGGAAPPNTCRPACPAKQGGNSEKSAWAPIVPLEEGSNFVQ